MLLKVSHMSGIYERDERGVRTGEKDGDDTIDPARSNVSGLYC